MTEKENIRKSLLAREAGHIPAPNWGKAAERVRGLVEYRQAGVVFAGPDTALDQVRINTLMDGKDLLLPTPGLKEGFLLIRPRRLPARQVRQAATFRQQLQLGERLAAATAAELTISFLVTDAVALDLQGGRLGDGQGFFDLAGAILAETDMLASTYTVVILTGSDRLVAGRLPQEPWDINGSKLISPEEVIELTPPPYPRPKIFWDALPLARIKKISPLWKLKEQRPGA
ncbi:MAG: hypothetical protein A2521_08990 [Deltaproteobacteria bacterium RIFOXYD12_FULL_57_12]|nr:MAG: hypothetical protein A2521_08990 [Deltaproteobacteria bacterium RIFOXYD12_FULL_57_12]